MTLHTAKGLEWPVVVLTGLEHGLFPLARAEEQPAGLEEERRLCYVGLTRAKDKLYLTWARARRRGGELRPGIAVPLSPGAFRPGSWTSGGRPRCGRPTGARAGGRSDGQADRSSDGSARRMRRAMRPPPVRPSARGELSQDTPATSKASGSATGDSAAGRSRGSPAPGGISRSRSRSMTTEVGVKQLLVAYAGLEREWESA